MHLVTASGLARLKANRKAYAHFERNRPLYLSIVKDWNVFASKYPAMDKSETKISLVSKTISEVDSAIWSLKTNDMTALEIADIFARMVVDHDT